MQKEEMGERIGAKKRKKRLSHHVGVGEKGFHKTTMANPISAEVVKAFLRMLTAVALMRNCSSVRLSLKGVPRFRVIKRYPIDATMYTKAKRARRTVPGAAV